MGKKKKTREEKILSQERHAHAAVVYSLHSVENTSKQNQTTPFIRKDSYIYVLLDIKKTFLISLFLIGIEVLLFVLLTQHIMKFPFVTY